LRRSVADYEVIRVLPPTAGGQSRYICRPPERLGLEETSVMVTELDVDGAGWRDLAARLSELAAVRSPHLLTLLETGPDEDEEGAGAYLASEAAPEGSAADPAGTMNVDDKVAAVAAAARGVHALHEAGLAHGSIDARALLLTERGPVLGPPRLAGPPGVVTTAREWRDVATLDPALLRGEAPSRSSDVWALAATLHGLLSRRPLYPGIEGDPLVIAVQRVTFTSPKVDKDLPPALAATLSSCFAADPAERPPTAAELADGLESRR
jgi:serine/threonine protein kinase